MVNSNPVLELILNGEHIKLILTTDLDGIVVCMDANTSRRDWLMTDAEFDNTRKRLRYELRWVSPEVVEHEVQVPALGYSGSINVGFFSSDNQEMRMSAVAYYLGSLNADGFIGAGFAFHPDQSPLWETIQQATAGHGYTYYGHDHSEKKGATHIETNENNGDFDRDNYIWSEPLVSLGDDIDGVSNAQGISFPIHDLNFACNVSWDSVGDAGLATNVRDQSVKLFGEFSSSWDVVVDFNVPCLQLPQEFYEALAGWIGLRIDPMLGLSEVAFPAFALPDLFFSLSFNGVQISLPLKSLVLPESSESTEKYENVPKICIQRSSSMLQRGTAAFTNPTTTAAEIARLERLHGLSDLPVYSMIDSPIIFGAMVLDALGSVVFDGITKRTGIRKSSTTISFDKIQPQRSTMCLQPVACTGQQEYVNHLNVCQDPNCSQYYCHTLDTATKHCVISHNWKVTLVVTTAIFLCIELFFSLSLRFFVIRSMNS
ncbi:hypothetical protein PHMEG_0009803 [Phytophthora megakarya]|uniref:Peptidase A1 domain-containing protein n=1 Tax=Phytophthora megakarya TaxID=4795 RepID=A0A225WGM5_9STRA|nr:hypothetical protein PHMEG_0009803 [Phytophthora megakarya]